MARDIAPVTKPHPHWGTKLASVLPRWGATHTRALLLLSLSACGGAATQTKSTTSASEEQSTRAVDERLSAPIVVKDVGFMSPESVLYDAERDLYLVTNVQGSALAADDQAFISRLKPDGSLDALKWIDSAAPDVTLDAPKGMALAGQVLYVADITFVRKFNRKTGAPMGSIRIPGATFLNDVAVDAQGNVLVSDSGISTGFTQAGTDAVYRIDASDRATPIVKGAELGGPNGLLAAAGALWERRDVQAGRRWSAQRRDQAAQGHARRHRREQEWPPRVELGRLRGVSRGRKRRRAGGSGVGRELARGHRLRQ